MKSYLDELYEDSCISPRVMACVLFRWVLATPESYSVLYHVLRFAAADFDDLATSAQTEVEMKPHYSQLASHFELAANLLGGK